MASISDNTNINTADDCDLETNLESTAQDNPPAAESAGKKLRVKWWKFSLAFVLILALLVCIFWEPLLLAIAPKPAVGIALSNTINALSDRYISCPITLLPTVKEYFYCGQIDADLSYQHADTSVEIESTLHTDWAQKRIFADGIFNFNGKELNADAYLDYDTAAIALEGFRKGAYIGFAYDTLQEDLNQTPLKLLLSDEKMQKLCTSAETFRQYFQTTLETPDAPHPDTKSFADVLIECVRKADADGRRCDVTLGDAVYPCEAVRFHIDQQTLVYLLEHLLIQVQTSESAKFLYLAANTEEGESEALWNAKLAQWEEKLEFLRSADSTACAVDFYIYEGYVVSADIDLSVTNQNQVQQMQLQIVLGPEPGKSDIRIDYKTQGTDHDLQLSLTSVSNSTDSNYNETFTLCMISDGNNADYALSIDWDCASGDLSGQIRINSREVQEQSNFAMILLNEEGALTVTADQNALRYFLPYLGIKNVPQDAQYSVRLIMEAGQSFETPEYTNISQWKTMWLLELVYYLSRL